jgi:predicted MPP superfamily phosphohydrolase
MKDNISEILDNDGNLMKKTSLGPENHRNNKTVSNQMTDYNINVGRQKFDSNFLGRFGFHFYEADNKGEEKLIDKLAKLEFEQYKNWVEYFVENFSKENLKKWVKTANTDFDKLSDEDKKSDYYNAVKVVEVLKKHVDDTKNKETITEVEEIVNKSDSKDILPKVENLMDLISTKEEGLEMLSHIIKGLNDKGLFKKNLSELLEYFKK